MLLTSCSVVKTESTNFHELATIIDAVKTDSTNLYKPPTPNAIVKTDTRNLYKLFALVKRESKNNYNPPTSFAAVRTDSPNFYMLLTDLLVVKTESTTLQNQATSFTADKNKLHEHLQASHMHCD